MLPAVRDPALGSRAMSSGYLLFVSSPAGYSLRELEGDPPNVGDELEDDGRTVVINKIGALPAPRRPAPLRLLVRQVAATRTWFCEPGRAVRPSRRRPRPLPGRGRAPGPGRSRSRPSRSRPHRHPPPRDRRSAAVGAQDPRPVVDPQAADRVGDRGDHTHGLDRARRRSNGRSASCTRASAGAASTISATVRSRTRCASASASST